MLHKSHDFDMRGKKPLTIAVAAGDAEARGRRFSGRNRSIQGG
jgi:hypothetical protein